ncbi:hypothetical protein VSX61_12330 [Brenneria populi subsp. brevivirga]|uniref:hypothetical protein n=1 Tax=Brenneria populi TaxID=1505588 RepID=UPI002E19770C|nr:hypothetical protein [Brenneria populi subsp. brevivirga]
MQEVYSLLLHILSPILLILLIRRIFYRLRDKKESADANDGAMKKISVNSFFLRLFGASREDYYFYQVREGKNHKIPFSDIISVKPKAIKINNRSVWAVRYLVHGLEKEIAFVHNLSFFNRNFSGFLSAVKSANPDADIKDLTLLTL